MKKLVAILGLSLLSACSMLKTTPPPPVPAKAPVAEAKPTPQVKAPKVEAPSDAAVEQKAMPVAKEEKAEEPKDVKEASEDILSKRSVFFDFDKFDVKPEYKDLVEAHAKYLAEHSDTNVMLEGNADERGSREYNLALGQKRAVAVKNVLTTLGVKDKQIETTSYGEEKPMMEGHDEDAWSHNRRTDIKYK